MNNNSNSTTLSVDEENFYQHTTFGVLAIVTNFITIFIYIRNPPLLKKSALQFNLAIGDIIEGIGLAASGIVRIIIYDNGTYGLHVSPMYCLMTFVLYFLLGIQIPASMFILMGLERFMAVYFFHWFHIHWSNKLSWKLTSTAIVCCLVSVLIALLLTYSNQAGYTISNECGMAATVGSSYLIFNYFFAIVGGSVGFVISLSAYQIFTKRKNRLMVTATNNSLHQRIKGQLRRTKIVLCATVVDIALVVIPSAILVSIVGFQVTIPGGIGGWSLRLISWRSSFNLFIYLIINTEFRRAAAKAFGLSVLLKKTQVAPFILISSPQVPNDTKTK